MNPVPSISKNSPLKIETVEEKYVESDVERKGKILFVLGILVAIVILIATWAIFVAWINTGT